VRAFGTDTAAFRLPPAADRYVAWLPAEPLCDAIVEVIVGTDTARAVWPLVLDTLDRAHPAVVVLNDDTRHTGKSDSLTVGKPCPTAPTTGSSRWAQCPWPRRAGAVETRLQPVAWRGAWVNSVTSSDAGLQA